MKCARKGCNKVVSPTRRRYCSDECRKMANRERVSQERRKEQLAPVSKRFRKQKLRTCLRCNKEFLSDGPWNRLCQACSEKNRSSRIRVFSVPYRWPGVIRRGPDK